MASTIAPITGILRAHAGERCRLVPLDTRHTDDVVRWRNDPNIARYFATSHRFTKEGHESWLAKAQASNTEANWIICEPDGAPVGMVALYNMDRMARTVEFGRLLVGERRVRGQGLARDAIRMTMAIAKDAGFARIHLEVLENNAPARGLYASLGFTEDGQEQDRIRMIHDL